MKAVYDAGIIGLGFIGAADQVSGDALGQQVRNLDGTHIDAYERHSRINIVAGSGRDLGRRNRFSARTGATTYKHWKDLISNLSLDIVSVATYTPVHPEITVACAKAGIPVIYCEKPIANNLKDAARMIAECRDASSLLVVNHNRRFSKKLRELRALLEDGVIGEIRSAHLQWGRGRLGNVGTHMFDAIRMLLKCEIQAVSGTLDESGKPDCRGNEFHDPGGWGLLRLSNGAIVTVSAPDYGNQPIAMEISGADGTVSVCSGDISFTMFDGTQPSLVDFQSADGDSIGESSMDVAVGEIIDWLDTGKEVSCKADESVKALEAIVAFHVSHRKGGGWVSLPLEAPDRDLIIHSG